MMIDNIMSKSVTRSPRSMLEKQGLFSSSEEVIRYGKIHFFLILLLLVAILLFVFRDDIVKIFNREDEP